MASERRLLSAALLCLAGPAIWFGCFALVYGAEALLCTRAASSRYTVFAVAAALIALVALALVARANWRHGSAPGATERFLGRAGIVLTALSTLAVLWLMALAATLEACLPPA